MVKNVLQFIYRNFIRWGSSWTSNHLFKMIELFNRHKSNIFVHCFLDGRDTNPTSGYENIKLLLDMIKKEKTKCQGWKRMWKILFNG